MLFDNRICSSALGGRSFSSDINRRRSTLTFALTLSQHVRVSALPWRYRRFRGLRARIYSTQGAE